MSIHDHLIHVDDVAVLDRGSGELQSRRRRLGAAAGAREIGVSRWEVAPGMRSTPAHVHADEEEVFYVLGGSGLSWQDGRTSAVGPGDCLVHRAGETAHTLLAGDDGLDVLVFGEGSRTHITWLPRAGVFWLGARWTPPDAPHPFKAELAAGPIERAEPEAQRPATIVHVDDVAPATDAHAGYEGDDRRLSAAAGSQTSGLRHVTLRGGSLSCPPHWHTAEEECFYVLAGSGTLWLDDARLPLRPGSFAVRPPGTGVAHALEAGPDGLTYLAYGQRRGADACFYPRSRKLNVGGVVFRVEPVDYYDGEEGGARRVAR